MHTVRIALLLLQALAVVDAATVKWTLHTSCYRTKDDQSDDNELAQAMIDAMTTSKDWALRGSNQLKESLIPIFGRLIPVRDAMKPLFDQGKYEDNAKDVIEKFDKLAQLEGPIGAGSTGTARYDRSQAWTALKNDNHYLNFLLVCRPSLENRQVEHSFFPLPYDRIRNTQLRNVKADLNTMIMQEDDPAIGDWAKIPGDRIQAITTVDNPEDRTGGRLEVPETITFHPLWLKLQRARQFSGWTDELFTSITHKDAVKEFEDKGKKMNMELGPVDGLLDHSFVRNVFHELFHLSAFGGMKDTPGVAYNWKNNVKYQSHVNPDFFAIVATVIELLNKDGKRYKVDHNGVVSRKLL